MGCRGSGWPRSLHSRVQTSLPGHWGIRVGGGEGVSSKWGPHTNSVVLLYFNLQLYYLKTSVFIFFLVHLSD